MNHTVFHLGFLYAGSHTIILNGFWNMCSHLSVYWIITNIGLLSNTKLHNKWISQNLLHSLPKVHKSLWKKWQKVSKSKKYLIIPQKLSFWDMKDHCTHELTIVLVFSCTRSVEGQAIQNLQDLILFLLSCHPFVCVLDYSFFE